jgi:hypothetical protein
MHGPFSTELSVVLVISCISVRIETLHHKSSISETGTDVIHHSSYVFGGVTCLCRGHMQWYISISAADKARRNNVGSRLGDVIDQATLPLHPRRRTQARPQGIGSFEGKCRFDGRDSRDDTDPIWRSSGPPYTGCIPFSEKAIA